MGLELFRIILEDGTRNNCTRNSGANFKILHGPLRKFPNIKSCSTVEQIVSEVWWTLFCWIYLNRSLGATISNMIAVDSCTRRSPRFLSILTFCGSMKLHIEYVCENYLWISTGSESNESSVAKSILDKCLVVLVIYLFSVLKGLNRSGPCSLGNLFHSKTYLNDLASKWLCVLCRQPLKMVWKL